MRPSLQTPLRASAAAILACVLLGGCAQDPSALLPPTAGGTPSAMPGHDGGPTIENGPITLEQLLARARGDAGAWSQPAQVGDAAGPRGEAISPPPAERKPMTVGLGPVGSVSRDLVVMVEGGTALLPAEPDATARARLAAAIDRQPGPVPVRIDVGPTASGDRVSGLARAQRYAEATAAALPARAQPVRLEYRPGLPAGAVVVELARAGEGDDGH